MKLTLDLVTETRRAVRESVAAEACGLSRRESLESGLATVSALATSREPLDLLAAFLRITTLLERYGAESTDARRLRLLYDLAKTILGALKIRPTTSLLSHLHAELEVAFSHVEAGRGQAWGALWRHELAEHLSRRAPSDEGRRLAATGERQLRLGDAARAAASFAEAESHGLEPTLLQVVRTRRILALRLAGRLAESASLAAATLELPDLSDATLRAVLWEDKCRAAMVEGDVGPLVTAVGSGGSHRQTPYVLEAILWSMVTPPSPWHQRVPRASTAKTLAGGSDEARGSVTALYRTVRTLQTCEVSDAPLAVRLDELGDVLRDVRSLGSVDAELLVWAAAARWLTRVRQFGLGQAALAEYEALSLRLSAGASRDALALRS